MMKIKQVSAQLNVSQKTIRYYEQCGLITPVKELKMGREFRDYDEETMARLRSIIVLRRMRFTIEEIQRIFEEPDSIAEICDVHRQQMSEEIALMTDICTLLEEISQEEIADGESLSGAIERRRKKMVLDQYLKESDLSKYDDLFTDYDLLEENRTAEQNSRLALAVNQYFTNFKAVFRLSDGEDQGRWPYIVLFSVIALSFLFASFFDIFKSSSRESEPMPTEKVIILSENHVSVAEEDYLTIERVRSRLRDVMIENPDPAFLQNLKQTLQEAIEPVTPNGDSRAMKVKKYNVSCIPLLGWNYETNKIDTGISGLIAFDDKQKFTYLLYLGEDENYLDGTDGNYLDAIDKNYPDATDEKIGAGTGYGLSFNGYYTMSLKLLQKDAKKRYIWTKADFFSECFIGEDGIAYEEVDAMRDDTIRLKGDYTEKFDWSKMAVSLEEITDPDNCIQISMKEGEGK